MPREEAEERSVGASGVDRWLVESEAGDIVECLSAPVHYEIRGESSTG